MNKNNLTYFTIAVLLIIGVVFFSFYMDGLQDPQREEEITKKEPVKEVDPLVMGAGWSNHQDEQEAVGEAVSMMLNKMEGEKPSFVIVYSESSYDNDLVLDEINQKLENVKVYGWTTFQTSVTNEGMHKLSILGFSDRLLAGVGGATLEEVNYPGEEGEREEIFRTAREAASLATNRAIADKDNPERKPRLVLVSGATYFMPGTIENHIEERFIEGIQEVVGSDIPIVGGLAADTNMAGNEKIFVNEKAYGFGSVSVALVYTDVFIGIDSDSPKIGYGFLGGFTPTTKKGVVTRAEGHLLYEIDGRDCTEVYDEWTAGELGERINSEDWVIDYTALYPIAKKISEDDTVPGYYNNLIHYFNNPDEGVCKVACEINEGDVVHLLEGTPSMFVNRGALTAMFARAEGRLSAEEIAGGYMVFCAGSFLAIPEEDYPKISASIDEAMSGAPFIGGYEFGGFGSFVGARENVFATQMTSFLIFGKY